MTLKRSTSAETASRFLGSYRRKHGNRQPGRASKSVSSVPAVSPAQSAVDRILAKRITLDLAPLTLTEILDCVVERVTRLQTEGKPIPHITRIALEMLHEATEKKP